ncbi:unnamed protein product [Heligmosomoides polygyrus]|uniref:Uncharacterized protein n=1 Tax=Heligmosomoides polygyrus TaxID=6339 RepID=A0A183GA43_HELPZ|nr:unnamed protein product [Heligmosomoides polygyrus]
MSVISLARRGEQFPVAPRGGTDIATDDESRKYQNEIKMNVILLGACSAVEGGAGCRIPRYHGAECWSATMEVETRFMETKMLRWTAGLTRLDRIRNDAIRQKFGVAPIAYKMREARDGTATFSVERNTASLDKP